MRRRPLAGELGLFGWLILPILAVVLGLMLMNLPIRLGAYPIPLPILSLIVVFLWGSYRPTPVAWICVFALGLVQDMLSFSAFGYWALINLVVYGLAAFGRRAYLGRADIVLWTAFGAVMVITACVVAGVSMLRSGEGVQKLMLAQLLVTVLVYPLVARLLSGMQTVAVAFHREDGF